jgi:hypothetical protein
VKRRNLLRTLVMLPLLPESFAANRAEAAGRKITQAPARRVRPSDPAWPSAASWSRLKREVGGNLIEVQPLFAACAADPHAPDCGDALKNAKNPFYLGDQPAGTQVSGWLDAWTPAASAYAVAARNAADVAAAVNFARDNNLRLVVKGGGQAVLDAFALAIIANGGPPPWPGLPFDANVAHQDARAVDAATAELRKIVPEPGSYVSESNYFNESWGQAFWGIHFAKLRAVKAKYDPQGLFFVHHGVGSDAWSSDGFTRLT